MGHNPPERLVTAMFSRTAAGLPDTLSDVRGGDEERRGEYRTRRLVLEAFAKLAALRGTGVSPVS
jgi:hypothetical protein